MNRRGCESGRKAGTVPALNGRQRWKLLTPQEIKAFLSALDRDWLAFFAICAFTGLRREEISRSIGPEIKLERSLIDLPAEKGKNNRHKLEEIPANLAKILKSFVRETAAVGILSCCKAPEHQHGDGTKSGTEGRCGSESVVSFGCGSESEIIILSLRGFVVRSHQNRAGAELGFARETRRRNLRRIPQAKSERFRRTWIPTTSLVTASGSPGFRFKGFKSIDNRRVLCATFTTFTTRSTVGG
jgi:integrase